LFASGGLDEAVIDGLVRAGAPIDGFGVGSALTTSSDKSALDIAYKLVEYAGKGCAKYSAGKATLPGAKQVFRTGSPARDVLERRGADTPGEPLLRPVWHDGRRPVISTIDDARARARAQMRALPADWRLPPGPDTPPLPMVGPDLASYADTVRRRVMATEAISC
jgi:nicotinate phosphoribosyltransferase